MSAVYRLPDEPLPSGLARHAVDPMWPLLALMLGGNAFGLAWFVFNGFALGTPERSREFLYAGLGLALPFAILMLLGLAHTHEWLSPSQLRYAALALVAAKIGVGYAFYLLQSRSFELWQHFGGRPASGLVPLVLIVLLGRRLLGSEAVPAWLAGVLA